MVSRPSPSLAPASVGTPAPPVKPAAGLSGPRLVLQRMGLSRPMDLALHLPLRYEDETRITRLADARDGDTVHIEATVVACEIQQRPRRQLVVTVDDGSDTCSLRFFSFYPSHQKTLAVGNRVRVRGDVRGGFLGWTLLHPVFRLAGGALPTALTPVYPVAAGLPQAYVRKAVHAALDKADLAELWPNFENKNAAWRNIHLRDALWFLHSPPASASLPALADRSHPAWQRLKWDELLAQQLSQALAHQARRVRAAPMLVSPPGGLVDQLQGGLPFGLTQAQARVVAEIAGALAQPVPMHRLLQGDVGSGKTVVAALSAAVCMASGWQCALMAPTEILAEQHFAKLVGWLEPMLAPLGRCVAWLTGSQKAKERQRMLARIASGEAALVVGTHALIEERVVFERLGLAVIDEQHRFGVAQRLRLRHKNGEAGLEPHVLMMTATPIPRTLAMSYFADLDVSTIDELPPGRTPVVTKVVSDTRREQVVERIRAQVAVGRQVYWVCPLIEESEAIDLTNATQTHQLLSQALDAPHMPNGQAVLVGLLHSRMPVAEKKAVMALFTAGHMGVLVSTTVIEVGVDVPNASLMVIEHAERFGLSQLHQLRGRVGRGAAASACVLLYATGESGRLGETARARLAAMAQTNDGFEIARRDLEIRGPGEFMGARQSGAALLRFADLAVDADLLEQARTVAPVLLRDTPDIAQRHVERWLGGRAEFLKA